MTPVLFGGRTPLRNRSFLSWFIAVRLPVVVMLAVIARESTALFGADNTSHWFRAAWELLFCRVSDARWPELHHLIRKGGHFLGYGLLGLAWLRAFLLAWMPWLRLQPARVWRGHCVALAVGCTALVASLDKLHQSFLPNRTGVPQDVLLDCTGAICLMGLCALTWLRPRRAAKQICTPLDR